MLTTTKLSFPGSEGVQIKPPAVRLMVAAPPPRARTFPFTPPSPLEDAARVSVLFDGELKKSKMRREKRRVEGGTMSGCDARR